MKKHFITLILITSLCYYGFAQPNIVWQKCFGGSEDDPRPKMEKTNDGGFIIAGDTWSNNGDIVNYHGWCDILIIKIDLAR